MGLNDAGRSHAYIRAYNPTKGNWSIFQAQFLPFGAVKSVHVFLCLARAVWWLGAVGCYLFWSSFFDDCIVFSPPKLAGSPELSAIALLKLLCWIFAEDGRKCNLFAVRCEALSHVFDLSDSNAGMWPTLNQEWKRCHWKSNVCWKLVAQRNLRPRSFRGKMQSAESQIYGRTGKRCIVVLRDFACRRRSKVWSWRNFS